VAVPDTGAVPRHVAIIMDGNGRWAKRRLLPRFAGHKAGVDAVRRIARAARAMGIEALTLYAFPRKTGGGPETEISDLMGLLRIFLRKDLAELVSDNVRLRVIGDYRRFAPDLVAMIDDAIARTSVNSGPVLAIALNYGAQAELVEAMKVAAGEMTADGITRRGRVADERPAAARPGHPHLGRTASVNFLLWQAAYAELMFVDTLWPDFDEAALADAVAAFGQRHRRFGGL
jgi:undecaprenyl diphosphate synthase